MQDEIEKIYKEYSKQVYNFIFSISHNEDLSEEIVQETFYIAIKNINKFRGECKINVWLCQIAKRLLYKQMQKSNKNHIRFENLLDEDTKQVSQENEEKIIEKDYLYSKIRKLDDLSQQIIFLRISSDLSFKQIGEIVGKTENYIRVKFYRIKEKLKEDINNNEK